MTLEETSVLIEGVTVQVTRMTGTDVSVVKELREAKAVVSAISGIQISKTQDRDAADVVRRIPGVTVIDNRFVNVRGLNDRYNSVWLNDAATPSTENDKKSFSFDIIPTQVIDRILVYKSPSPELPGDFAGGMVKIYTKTSMPSNNWIINFSQGYRNGSTLKDINYDTKSSTDFLGFDDGSRNIPVSDRIGSSKLDEASAAHQFSNTYAIHKTTALPDLRFSVVKGSSFSIAQKSIESVSLLTYSNTYSLFNIQRNTWDDRSPATNYMDNQSTNQIRLGAMQNFGIRLNERNKIEWRNLFNQIGTGQTTLRYGRVLAPYENTYIESYQSRAIISSQISGKHTWAEGKSEYTWTGGFSYTHRNDPDLKRMTYNQNPNNPNEYDANIPPGTEDPRWGGRFYQRLYEQVYSFTHNYLHKFEIGNSIIDFNVGNYGELKNRSFGAREVGYVLDPSTANKAGLDGQGLKQLPIGEIFSPQYVGTGGFIMNENTSGSNFYRGENRLLATYVSLGLPISDKWKFSGGLRSEYSIQSIFTANESFQSRNDKLEQLNWLPSANLSYNFTQKALIRATYGRSLNRPEFREWAPFSFYDTENQGYVFGSLAAPPAFGGGLLKNAVIDNFDLRFELYPSSQELFHIGVFYKNFQNPIERYILPSSNRLFTFGNANSAYVAGIEFDLRKNMGFLGGGIFRDLSLVANASLIQSEINVKNGVNLIEKRPLQGQSPYVINAGFYYQEEDKGITASLTYNVFGPRSILVGTKTDGSWGELPRNTIDIAINYPLSRRIALTFAVQDLLNQPVQVVQDTNLDGKFQRHGNNDLLINKFRRGQYFNLGLKWTL
ncbi:MAG: TonB-dependent receptor [Cyclobacteriaceae bacterium]